MIPWGVQELVNDKTNIWSSREWRPNFDIDANNGRHISKYISLNGATSYIQTSKTRT